MIKRVVVAVAATVCVVQAASVQSSTISTPVPIITATSTLNAVETCEGQMRRLARLNKVLGATYNAAHVHKVCVDNTSVFK